MRLFIYQWQFTEKCLLEGYGMTLDGTHVCISVIDVFNFVFSVFNEEQYIPDDGPIVELCHLYHPTQRIKYQQVFFKERVAPSHLTSVYDARVDMYIKCLSYYHLPPNGWIDIPDGQTSLRRSDIKVESDISICPMSPRVLSFDIEVYSINPRQIPSPNIVENVIFQICLILSDGRRRLLSLDKVYEQDDFEVVCCVSELHLLEMFLSTVKEWDPTICIGYNIFGFDLPYIKTRLSKYRIQNGLETLGMQQRTQKMVDKTWESSAHGSQRIFYPDSEGRLWLDMFVYMKRNFKTLQSYKLNSVAELFLGSEKDPLTHLDIFESYRTHDPDLLTKVARYCIQDGVLTLDLFHKLDVWVSYTEMSRICNVPIHYLHTRGEQIKTFAQVYQYCIDHGFLIDAPVSVKREKYQGATVMDPVPGMYRHVVPFDFASLYPTTMIVYNIDITTMYHGPGMPDNIDDYHCIEVSNNQTYYFKKAPLGVIPTILHTLLETRKHVREQMRQTEDGFVRNLLNKRQLSYKLSANSMYGVLGQSGGLLPFVAGAESITAQGRKNLQQAGDLLQSRFQAHLVYQDTDSCYCQFPHVSSSQLYEYAEYIERILVEEQIFRTPMKLEFEETVYDSFYIPTKKKYFYTHLRRDGNVSTKIECKGFEKRDTCLFARHVYLTMIQSLFEHVPKDMMLQQLLDLLLDARTHQLDKTMFCMTKTVANPLHYKALEHLNKNVHISHQFLQGTYFPWIEKLQAHMKLAHRMIRRGTPLEYGDRIAYVVTERGQTLSEQIEDMDYFMTQKTYLRVNAMKYIHDICHNISSLFTNVFKDETCVKVLYQTFKNKEELHEHYKKMMKPVIICR